MDASTKVTYKVAVVGLPGVGKSSIIRRFVKGSFSRTYTPTTRIEAVSVTRVPDSMGRKITLEFWEIPYHKDAQTEAKVLKDMSAIIIVNNESSWISYDGFKKYDLPILFLFNQKGTSFDKRYNVSLLKKDLKLTEDNVHTVSAEDYTGINDAINKLLALLHPSPPLVTPSVHRVCVLGDASVGKTSIIKRYVNGSFDSSYSPTKTINGIFTQNGITFTEIPASSSLKDIAFYMKDATEIIYVIDGTREYTIDNAEATIAAYLKLCPPNTPYLILVNKNDILSTTSDALRELFKRTRVDQITCVSAKASTHEEFIATIDKFLNVKSTDSELEIGVARFRDVLKNNREIVLVHNNERYFARDVTEHLYFDTLVTNRYMIKCGIGKSTATDRTLVYFLIEHVTSKTADPVVRTTSFNTLRELKEYVLCYPSLDKMRTVLSLPDRVKTDEY